MEYIMLIKKYKSTKLATVATKYDFCDFFWKYHPYLRIFAPSDVEWWPNDNTFLLWRNRSGLALFYLCSSSVLALRHCLKWDTDAGQMKGKGRSDKAQGNGRSKKLKFKKRMEMKLKGQYYWALSYRPYNFQAKRDSACAWAPTERKNFSLTSLQFRDRDTKENLNLNNYGRS